MKLGCSTERMQALPSRLRVWFLWWLATSSKPRLGMREKTENEQVAVNAMAWQAKAMQVRAASTNKLGADLGAGHLAADMTAFMNVPEVQAVINAMLGDLLPDPMEIDMSYPFSQPWEIPTSPWTSITGCFIGIERVPTV